MKNKLKLSIIFTISFILTWGLFGFIVNDWKIENWWRIGVFLLGFFPGGITMFVYEYYKLNKDEI